MARISVTGNVGTEPEIKFYEGKNGNFGICSFSIAETERIKDNAGNWVDGDTTWYRVSVLGKNSETIVDSVTKGSRIKVEGTFKQSQYKGRDGEVKNSLEIKADEITLAIKPKKAESKPQFQDPWATN